jgi:hypothetical protein
MKDKPPSVGLPPQHKQVARSYRTPGPWQSWLGTPSSQPESWWPAVRTLPASNALGRALVYLTDDEPTVPSGLVLPGLRIRRVTKVARYVRLDTAPAL